VPLTWSLFPLSLSDQAVGIPLDDEEFKEEGGVVFASNAPADLEMAAR
jgi:hypothetical protein